MSVLLRGGGFLFTDGDAYDLIVDFVAHLRALTPRERKQLEAGTRIGRSSGWTSRYSSRSGHEHGGKLYPRFVSNHAATNRSSSVAQHPADPLRKEGKSGMRLLVPYGMRCRALFRPQDGWVLVGTDLAGIEVRLLGHRLAPYDGGAFAELVVSGADIHERNSQAIGITREHAKTVLYGSMYGLGAGSLAADLGISADEAHKIISAFTTGIKGFAAMKRDLLSELRTTGRITLIDRRRLQVSSAHKALNYAIQGDAAILMKHWAMESARRLEATSWRVLAVVHDEIQGECLPGDVAKSKGYSSRRDGSGQRVRVPRSDRSRCKARGLLGGDTLT